MIIVKSIRNKYKNNSKAQLLYHVVRWFFLKSYRKNYSLIDAGDKWHRTVSYYLADKVYFIFKPIVSLFENKKILFSINNISHATGHVYPEIDYLYRLKWLSKIDNNYKIYCVWPKSHVSAGFAKSQKDNEIKFILSGLLHVLIYPLLIRYPKIAISTSQSNLNHSLHYDNNNRAVFGASISYVDTFRVRQKEYAIVRSLSQEYYPLCIKQELTKPLIDLIGNEKYFVIQIKDQSVNATYKPVNPETYILAISEMKKMGHAVVFAGREVMPSYFALLGVINYSQSPFASAYHDYLLVLNSAGVVASASGFCFIADTLGVPLLSLNNWHINGYPGGKTIQIPSLLNLNGIPLKFIEQLEYAYQRGQISPNGKKIDQNIVCYDATSQDIHSAFLELVDCASKNQYPPMTPLQLKFNKLFPLDIMSSQLSRVSNQFLINNMDRF